MRLIHTADVHLDACYASAGFPHGFGNRRRQCLRDVTRKIIARAGAWPADALLIAGDLWEQDRVTGDTVAFLRSEFESIPEIPVFIAPGNHDPYTADSPYATESWPENVHIFTKPEWTAIDLPGGAAVVHGFGFDGPEVSVNPFGALEVPDDGRVHVMLAHGSEQGHQPPEQKAYAPFDAAQAMPEGVVYAALGHFHRTTEIPGAFPGRMFYAGTPEGQSFKEAGMHHYLEVEISSGSIEVTPVPCSRTVFSTHTIDCSAFVTAQQVLDALRGLPNGRALARVARVVLTGSCPQEVQDAVPALRDSAEDDFEHLELVDETEPAEDYDSLALEQTSLGHFIRKLNAEVADAPTEGERRLAERVREVGLAANRGRELAIHGLAGD